MARPMPPLAPVTRTVEEEPRCMGRSCRRIQPMSPRVRPPGRSGVTMNRPIACLCLALLTAACRGKLVATAELHGPGTADAHFQSTGEPLFLWADTDGTWTGSGRYAHFPAHYEIDVLSKGAQVGHVACDSLHSTESV